VRSAAPAGRNAGAASAAKAAAANVERRRLGNFMPTIYAVTQEFFPHARKGSP
jgi:hypothetical protein